MSTATDSILTWHPLADGCAPEWASGWGQDAHGPFVEFALDGVAQRLRWIPPGRFQMGSPEDEPGRFDGESPRHWVEISSGFWLFDTPCTQALWETVMGDNPSYFVSPDRPVEQVSWQDCQQFLERFNKRISGLKLSLPTEAEWEYACRAGTTEAIYAGPLEILGDGNAPALDAVAWYGGNCGVDFELSNGVPVTWLSNKQYEFEKGGTHTVGLKQPNPWGLYDSLGNVWEWCRDGRRSYEDRDEQDPIGSEEPSADRVIRGGAWLNVARSVRAACRFWRLPAGRNGDLGFRCRVQ
jgi:formylglycine-generating enzyme required for sulfatase activity